MKIKLFTSGLFCLLLFSIEISIAQTDSATDIDGNVYKTVVIGTQTWMAEDLRTTKLNNGNPIPNPAKHLEWWTMLSPAYCWYDNNEELYGKPYGAIYNWYAVNTKELCPSGWHVATEADWTILIDFLGGKSVAGGKLKETGNDHWAEPNTGATNQSGFNALPGGGRANIGYFKIGTSGFWWTSSVKGMGIPRYVSLSKGSAKAALAEYKGSYGFNVRCIKD
jgi:uncharacterized protein (TIGR02145 family)